MTKTVIRVQAFDAEEQLMTEMTRRRFRHMHLVERDRLIGVVSIGDLVKITEIEMEATATREYTGLGGLSNPKRNLHDETIART